MFGRKEKLELEMQASTIRILQGRLDSMSTVVADLRVK